MCLVKYQRPDELVQFSSVADKTRSTEEGNGKPLQYSCLQNPMNSMKTWNICCLSNIADPDHSPSAATTKRNPEIYLEGLIDIC